MSTTILTTVDLAASMSSGSAASVLQERILKRRRFSRRGRKNLTVRDKHDLIVILEENSQLVRENDWDAISRIFNRHASGDQRPTRTGASLRSAFSKLRKRSKPSGDEHMDNLIDHANRLHALLYTKGGAGVGARGPSDDGAPHSGQNSPEYGSDEEYAVGTGAPPAEYYHRESEGAPQDTQQHAHPLPQQQQQQQLFGLSQSQTAAALRSMLPDDAIGSSGKPGLDLRFLQLSQHHQQHPNDSFAGRRDVFLPRVSPNSPPPPPATASTLQQQQQQSLALVANLNAAPYLAQSPSPGSSSVQMDQQHLRHAASRSANVNTDGARLHSGIQSTNHNDMKLPQQQQMGQQQPRYPNSLFGSESETPVLASRHQQQQHQQQPSATVFQQLGAAASGMAAQLATPASALAHSPQDAPRRRLSQVSLAGGLPRENPKIQQQQQQQQQQIRGYTTQGMLRPPRDGGPTASLSSSSSSSSAAVLRRQRSPPQPQHQQQPHVSGHPLPPVAAAARPAEPVGSAAAHSSANKGGPSSTNSSNNSNSNGSAALAAPASSSSASAHFMHQQYTPRLGAPGPLVAPPQQLFTEGDLAGDFLGAHGVSTPSPPSEPSPTGSVTPMATTASPPSASGAPSYSALARENARLQEHVQAMRAKMRAMRRAMADVTLRYEAELRGHAETGAAAGDSGDSSERLQRLLAYRERQAQDYEADIAYLQKRVQYKEQEMESVRQLHGMELRRLRMASALDMAGGNGDSDEAARRQQQQQQQHGPP